MGNDKQKKAYMWHRFLKLFFFPFVYVSVVILFVTSSHCDAFWEFLFAREDAPRAISLPLPFDRSTLKTVRVAILSDVDTATLTFDSHTTVQLLKTDEHIDAFISYEPMLVRPTQSGVVVGSHAYPVFAVRLSAYAKRFVLNDREYRGDLVIIRQKDMKLLFVNYIDIDDYLKGVLPKEVSPRWGIEALKAQAVVARTYALFQELNSVDRDYSLEKTVASQVYGGASVEAPETTRAVQETRGQIMVFEGNIFPSYFSADCGGHTARPETVWETYSHNAMSGVTCSYCRTSKHHTWSQTISLRDIEKALQSKKLYAGSIYSIEAPRMDESGRVVEFLVHGSAGSVVLQSNQFRIAVGPQLLKSTKISKMRFLNNAYYFEGYGWGHGVGFCQWGSKAMAEQHYTYKQILRYYFQKVQFVDL
jgi:stage II sporulation protein D